MDKVAQTGKKINAIRKETVLNARRKTENFLQPERIVNSFNKLHAYKTKFTSSINSKVLLNLKIVEFPISCAVNPPLLNVSTSSYISGDNPGVITRLTNTTSVLDPPNPDFVLVSSTATTHGGIQVPLDGCYSVRFTSGAWGVGYYSGKYVTVQIFRNQYSVVKMVQRDIGVLILLGPWIFTYAPASPVYCVVDCKAGDTIAYAMVQDNIGQGYDWYNGPNGLGGFFYAPENIGLVVTLVAEAEK